MAILEIAKIQVRRGQENVTGLPQLASGEFAWAIDTQKLYIGNGSLDEGAPEIGNTEILTEHSIPYLESLFTVLTNVNYIYQGHSTAEIITGPDIENDIQRTVQQKLDDYVNLYDFGGVLNDVSGEALQNAIYQLFLNTDKTEPSSRVTLKIPAGIFYIDRTIYIPPYTNIVGEGKDKTVLIVSSDITDPLFYFCDQTSLPGIPGSPVLYPSINSGSRPTNIFISGITFQHGPAVSLDRKIMISADCAKDSIITNCKFVGNYEAGVTGPFSNQEAYAAIEIRGQSALTTENLIIDNCTFNGFGSAILSNFDHNDTIISNCKFENLYRGITYNYDLSESGDLIGPIRSRIINNSFENIDREAVYVGANDGTPTDHLLLGNNYKEVGNYLLGDNSSYYSIVKLSTNRNKVIEDYYKRFDYINLSGDNFIQPIEGNYYLNDHSVYVVNTLTNSTTTLLKLPHNQDSQKFKIDYSTVWDGQGISRKGELLINVATTNVEPYNTATITDSYTYFGPSDGGSVFTANLNTMTHIVSVDHSIEGSYNGPGRISFKYSQLQ